MNRAEFTWILFDAGNVLVELKNRGLFRVAQALGTTPQDLAAFVESSGLQARANTGQASPEQYIQTIGRRYGRSLRKRQVVALMEEDINTPLAGIETILEIVHSRCRIAVLSDTFFAHWETFKQLPLTRHIDLMMPSHETGMMKTDIRAFRHALKRLGAMPAEVLFIDDLEVNVKNARRCGITAYRSQTPLQTLAILFQSGLAGM